MTKQEIVEMLERKLDMCQALINDGPVITNGYTHGYKQAILDVLKLVNQSKQW